MKKWRKRILITIAVVMSVWIFAGWILFCSVWSSHSELNGSIEQFSPNLRRAVRANIRSSFSAEALRLTQLEFLRTKKHLRPIEGHAYAALLLPYMSLILSDDRAEEILLKETYLGQQPDGLKLVGFEGGAKYYLRKDARDLSLADSFLLITVSSSPARNDPLKFPELALKDRNGLMQMVAHHGKLSQEEVRIESARPLFDFVSVH